MEAGDVRYISADQKHAPAPFKLQAPPIKVTNATPKVQQLGFTPLDSDRPTPRVTTVTVEPRSRTPSPQVDQRSPLIINAPPLSARFGAPPMSARSFAAGPLSPRMIAAQEASIQSHVAAAPGEQVFAAVPIPGAYEAPLSPGFENRHMQFPRM
jgi:hypothetical protein